MNIGFLLFLGIYRYYLVFISLVRINKLLYIYVLVLVFYMWFYMSYLQLFKEYIFCFCLVGYINYRFLLFYGEYVISMFLLVFFNLNCENWYVK